MRWWLLLIYFETNCYLVWPGGACSYLAALQGWIFAVGLQAGVSLTWPGWADLMNEPLEGILVLQDNRAYIEHVTIVLSVWGGSVQFNSVCWVWFHSWDRFSFYFVKLYSQIGRIVHHAIFTVRFLEFHLRVFLQFRWSPSRVDLLIFTYWTLYPQLERCFLQR